MKSDLNLLINSLRPPETPGSFLISLEGIEGCGKTTQIKKITEYLEEKRKRVLCLREPGGTIFGEKLRLAILESNTSIHPLAECHLFLAARAQLLSEKILPFLLVPESVVILDRYIDSTLAYQGKARKLTYETVLTLHQFNPLNLVPHRTYFLDIDLQTSLSRQQTRGNKKDYFETEQQEFYLSLIKGYHEIGELFKDRIMRLDATKTIDHITQTILTDLNRIYLT